jgi:predicted DNA-binding transcriptional regulator YafY
MADFFRRPLALSLREALTLLLAASALAGVEGLPESGPLTSAVEKLRGALGTDARLAIDIGAPGDEHLDPLRRAVRDRRVVHLVYRSGSKAETTERDVDPWSVVGANGAWYLHGWCRSAGGARHFRLDRIRSLDVTGQEAATEPPSESEPAAYVPDPDDELVVLDLRPGAWWLPEWVVGDEVSERDGLRRLAFRTPELEWVARLLLRLGDDAVVVEPPELARRARTLAAAALARYGDGSAPRTGD